MNRYFEENDFENTEVGNLVAMVSSLLIKGTKEGLLPGCKVVTPLITDEKELLDIINGKLNTKATKMVYIPVIGTEENFLQEAHDISPLLELLSKDYIGTVFKDTDMKLVEINALSIQGQQEPRNVHNVFFLMEPNEDKVEGLVS